MPDSYPQRIVCAAAEVPEILHALGCLDRVVGVSSFTKQPPEALEITRIGGFNTDNTKRILALNSDLVITISDIQAQLAAELIGAGIPVLALNPHSLTDIWQSILLIGGAVGKQTEAWQLVDSLIAQLDALSSTAQLNRPRIYFEEWHEPPITGIGWVGDLIHAVGGIDIFEDLSTEHLAKNRIISFAEVAHRRPDIIVASWCGKPADLASIWDRAEFSEVPAIQSGHVYEINSDLLLQTGPSLIKGAKELHNIIQAYHRGG